MKPIKGALQEIRRLQVATRFFSVLLNTIIAFLLFFFVLIFFKLNWMWSLIPGILYFVYAIRKSFRRISLKEVEARVPQLREKLRTAADNIGRDDELVRELNSEVMRDIRRIRSSQFLDTRKNAKKLIGLGAVAFLILLIAAFNVDFFEIDLSIFNKFDENEYPTLENINKFEDYGFDEDIYGEESIVELGTEEVSIAMNTMSGGLDLNEQKEVERLNFGTTFQNAIDVEADRSFEEKKRTQRQDEIMRKYFDQITSQG